jgi:hypothetical protein
MPVVEAPHISVTPHMSETEPAHVSVPYVPTVHGATTTSTTATQTGNMTVDDGSIVIIMIGCLLLFIVYLIWLSKTD